MLRYLILLLFVLNSGFAHSDYILKFNDYPLIIPDSSNKEIDYENPDKFVYFPGAGDIVYSEHYSKFFIASDEKLYTSEDGENFNLLNTFQNDIREILFVDNNLYVSTMKDPSSGRIGVYKSTSLNSFVRKLDYYSSDWDWYDLTVKNGSVYASHYLGKKIFKEDASGNFVLQKSLGNNPREIEVFNDKFYMIDRNSTVVNVDNDSILFYLGQSLGNFDVLGDYLYVFGNHGRMARIDAELNNEYILGISYRISTMSKFKNNYLVFGTSSAVFSVSENGFDNWKDINLGQGIVYGIEEGNGKILLKTKNGIFHY